MPEKKYSYSKLPQLFIFHFAGGNVYSFNFLKKYLDPYFEVICLELPGRGKRMNEDLIYDTEGAVLDQLAEFNKFRDKYRPYILYGHSMGAVIGFEMIKVLEESKDFPQLFISTGNPGPGDYREKNRHKLNQDDFIDALKELGGIPDEIYDNKELFSFFEPILRADFELVERYDCDESESISTPIYCAMGSKEKYVSKITNWENFTKGNFEHETFEGNHFFINDHPEKLAQFIKKAFNDTLALQY
jgi:surfactin synthase thioesterase subunit